MPNTILDMGKRYPQTGPEPLKCPHCKSLATRGTHQGCHNCGRVMFAIKGRMPPYITSHSRAAFVDSQRPVEQS